MEAVQRYKFGTGLFILLTPNFEFTSKIALSMKFVSLISQVQQFHYYALQTTSPVISFYYGS